MANALPFPRILLGPGPSSVTPRVLEALARAPLGYLDPELFEILEALREDLRFVFGTKNAFTLPLTGTGMAGMESCLVNLIEPGDNVVIGVHGFFGGRMVEICRRLGANVVQVDGAWGQILDPNTIRSAVKSLNTVKLVACVHAETSTGVRQPLEEIARIAHEQNALFLVDAVTSLGGIAVQIDEVGGDVCYSGTQKCVGAPPGLAPITANERAWEVVTARQTPVPNWYYDWKLLRAYYDEPHAYHHTVPVNLLTALRAALQEIREEGLEARFARHRDVSALLISGLADMGILPFAQEGYRLPTLNAVTIPSGIEDEAAVRKRLLTEYGLEIGGGLGALKGKIWRIGTMGASATPRNVRMLLAALRSLLPRS
ncbi:MAG TPA: alanine--glyoxylate aminotransferase family protein [Chthonomonadaceae bacterium]|nr:alanine--glyoxylate aminotransferase family protein [Chthonomonadaceae bacterium]